MVYGASRVIVDRTKNRIRTLLFACGGFLFVLTPICMLLAKKDSSYYYLVFSVLFGVALAFVPALLTALDKNKKDKELEYLKGKSELADFNKEVLEKLNLIDAQLRIVTCLFFNNEYEKIIKQIKFILGKIILEDIKLFIDNKSKKVHPNLSLFMVEEREDKAMGFKVLADTYLSETETGVVEKDFYWKVNEAGQKTDYMGVASYVALKCKTEFIQELEGLPNVFWSHWVDVDDEANERKGMLYCRPIFEGQADHVEGEAGNQTLAVVNVTCPKPIDGTVLAQFIDIYSRNIASLIYLYKCANRLLDEAKTTDNKVSG